MDSQTKSLGLLGNPVEHSYSPLIHGAFSELYDDNAAYLSYCVAPNALGDAVHGAYALGMLGLNVTVPYKQAVIPHLEALDPLAAQIGAVNTLVRCNQGFLGFNTDLPGLSRAMKSDHVSLYGADVILLGAGGAARAAAFLAAKEGAASLRICNRSPEKATALSLEINQVTHQEIATALSYSDLLKLEGTKRFLVIQSTNVGLFPRIDETPITEERFFEKIHTAYDLIFNPLETKFLRSAKKAGAKTYSGAKMLLYQAVCSYELWFKHPIEEWAADIVLRQFLDQLQTKGTQKEDDT
ncbi:MAG: shikimate dehydrogenase [Lachnospiraceae bacterium]|nr:shikimate dehydrogenase [Lachnospiraceae bacterium]